MAAYVTVPWQITFVSRYMIAGLVNLQTETLPPSVLSASPLLFLLVAAMVIPSFKNNV